MQKLRRNLLAILLSISFNILLLVAMSQLNASGSPKHEILHTPPRIDIAPIKRPKPQKAQSRTNQRIPFKSSAAALPALQIPSQVAIPEDLMPTSSSERIIHPTPKTHVLSGLSELILTEDMVDVPPKVLSRINPQYPAQAESLGIEGFVQVRLLIDKIGQVEQVVVLDAQPSGIFEHTATIAVSQWRFSPASLRGENLKVWVRQKIEFRLQ
jgi:protein TonB